MSTTVTLQLQTEAVIGARSFVVTAVAEGILAPVNASPETAGVIVDQPIGSFMQPEIDRYLTENDLAGPVSITRYAVSSDTLGVRVYFNASTQGQVTVDATERVLGHVEAVRNLPAAPQLVGEAKSTTAVLWQWSRVDGVTGYRLLDEYENIVAELGPEPLSWLETALVPNETYARKIAAFTDEGQGASSPSYLVTTLLLAPSTPSNFAGVPEPNGRVTWLWETYGEADGVLVLNEDGEVIFDLPIAQTSAVEEGHSPASVLVRRLVAYNGAGRSASVEATVETLHLPSEFPVRPLAPARFRGAAKGPNSILWSWGNLQGISGYYLYDESGARVATIPAFQHEYLEQRLLPDETYTRYLTAYNKDGESGPSPVSSTTTLSDFVRALREQAPIEVVHERLKAFQSGIGDGRDLHVKRPDLKHPLERFDYEMFVQGAIDKTVEVHPTVNFDFRFHAAGQLHTVTTSGRFIAAVRGALASAVIDQAVTDSEAVLVDLAALVGEGPYSVEKTGGDENTFAHFADRPYDRTTEGIITNATAALVIEAAERIIVTPWEEDSDWYSVSVNGRQPLTSPGAGRAPLRMPLTMPVPADAAHPVYSVEIRNVAPAAEISWFWDEGDLGHQTDRATDTVNFESAHTVSTTLRTFWRGAKVRGEGKTVSPGKRLRFLEKLPTPALDPTWTADVKDLKVVVTTTNPNVAMSLTQNQAIAWTTTGIPFLAMDFEAWVLNPTQTAWAPLVHNGFYYVNNHEHFLYARDEVRSRIAAEAIYRTLPVMYSIRAYGERFTPAETILYADTEQADFTQGTGSGVSVSQQPGRIVIRTDGDGHLLPVGEYLSSVKEFSRIVKTWMPVRIEAVVPPGAKVECLTRSFADGNWSPWEPVRGDVPASPAGTRLQYRLALHAGGDRVLSYPTFSHEGAGTFGAATLLSGMSVTPEGRLTLDEVYEGYAIGPVIDLGTEQIESMGRLSAAMEIPEGASITWYTVSADSPAGPWDGTAQPWMRVDSQGNIKSAKKRYITWIAVVKTSNPTSRPAITRIHVDPVIYTTASRSPEVDGVTVGAYLDEQRQVEIHTITQTANLPANKLYYQVTDRTVTDTFAREFADKQISVANLTITGYDITSQEPGVHFKFSTDGSSIVQAATNYQAFANAYYQEKVVVSRANRAEVSPLPQQGAPVIVSDQMGPMRQVFFMSGDGRPSLTHTEEMGAPGGRQIALGYPEIDTATVRVWVDHTGRGEWTPSTGFRLQDNILTLAENLDKGTMVRVQYRITRSFVIDYDYAPERDTALLMLHGPVLDEGRAVAVHYECATETAYYHAREVNVNPLFNPVTAGFLYLTTEIEPAKALEVRLNPSVLNANGYDRTTIFVRAKDRYGNPVAGNQVTVQATAGHIRVVRDTTDEHGMVTAIFQAPEQPGEVTITVADLTAGLQEQVSVYCRSEGENATLSVASDKPVFSLMIPDERVLLTARTMNQLQNYEAGNTVIYETTWGMLVATPSDAGTSSYTGMTDPNGISRVYLKRVDGEPRPGELVTISVRVLTQEGHELAEDINVRLVEV